MEFNSAIKKNEIMLLSGQWYKEIIMLSKRSQSYKDKYQIFSLICRIWEGEEDIEIKGRLLGMWKGNGKRVRRDNRRANMIKVHYMHV
jgi:hypothetical protein